MFRRPVVPALVVVLLGAVDLARPHNALAYDGCPVLVTVSYCPESEHDFCMAYGCNTPVSACEEFGGMLRVYCGTGP